MVADLDGVAVVREHQRPFGWRVALERLPADGPVEHPAHVLARDLVPVEEVGGHMLGERRAVSRTEPLHVLEQRRGEGVLVRPALLLELGGEPALQLRAACHQTPSL